MSTLSARASDATDFRGMIESRLKEKKGNLGKVEEDIKKFVPKRIGDATNGGGNQYGNNADGNGLNREETDKEKWTVASLLKGRLHGAFSRCVFVSDKPFEAEACDIGGQASATNGLSDIQTHIKNALCHRPLKGR
jgi:hypothetical protein